MLAKSMDFKAIFGEVYNILFKKFDLDPSRCRGFMLDGCAANLKALLALTTHCVHAVGMRCISRLFNNTGNKVESTQIESTQIDRFAGALHTILSHSHNASQQWRAATKTASPNHHPIARRRRMNGTTSWVRKGLALTQGVDGNFGTPHLPNGNALIRIYYGDNATAEMPSKWDFSTWDYQTQLVCFAEETEAIQQHGVEIQRRAYEIVQVIERERRKVVGAPARTAEDVFVPVDMDF
eukprot:jgi/Undpi1/5673/HiC_scaffold_2.g00947.m1